MGARQICDWEQISFDGDEENETWVTDCGHWFTLNEGNPFENNIRYCCFCGKLISVTPLIWDGESEKVVRGGTLFFQQEDEKR